MSGSVGEGIRSGSVLVVKTHNVEREWAKQACSDPHSVRYYLSNQSFIIHVKYYKFYCCVLLHFLHWFGLLYSCHSPMQYKAAILLIRNPYDAIVSFYKFRLNQEARARSHKTTDRLNPHVVEAGQEKFGKLFVAPDTSLYPFGSP